MRRPRLISRLLRRFSPLPDAPGEAPPAGGDPAFALDPLQDDDFERMLTLASGHSEVPDGDWISALDRDFDRLPLLPALALLHYINPNDAHAKVVDRLNDVPLDEFGRAQFGRWRGGRIESASLGLAMAVEYCGTRLERADLSALADAIRMMSLSNRSVAVPESAESAQSIASCAAGVARALVRDSRELFTRTDLNREMLANLAFICLGWRSASANMTRFTGAERSFNHIAFGIGHELSRSADVFHAVALSETAPLRTPGDGAPPGGGQPAAAAAPHGETDHDDGRHDDIPSGFDGDFEDPIIENLPTDEDNRETRDDAPVHLCAPEDAYDDDMAESIPLPAEPEPRARPAAVREAERPGVVVCWMRPEALKDRRTSELAASHRHAIGVPVRLVPTPDLAQARRRLVAEFPYAVEAVDLLLNDLVGRRTLKFEPKIVFGRPGSGKSRFVRRVATILEMGLFRTDAARADGNTFGGTDRRWYSAEPCHPFQAISRTHTANPLVLIDEIEKAASRTDYGRLWDTLLGFLEIETARCYPDPALQCELDLGHVSYLMTGNDLDNLPHALRDRAVIVDFPEPKAEHLDALLKPVFDDYLRTRNIDPAWAPPLAPIERDALARHWKGGSVRKLARLMAGVMRARERTMIRH